MFSLKLGQEKTPLCSASTFHYTRQLCQQQTAKTWEGKTNQDYVGPLRISRNFSVVLILFTSISHPSLFLLFTSHWNGKRIWLSLSHLSSLGSLWRRGVYRIKLHRYGPLKSSSEYSRTSFLYS